MAAAPDDDARRTLAELEAKLRELERELLRGHEPDVVEADPFAAPPDEAPAQPTAPAALRPEETPPAFDPGEWAPPEPEPDSEPEPEPEPEPLDAAEPEPLSAPAESVAPDLSALGAGATEPGTEEEPLADEERVLADEEDVLADEQELADEEDVLADEQELAASPEPTAQPEAAEPPPSTPLDAEESAEEPEPIEAAAPLEPEPEPVPLLDHDALAHAHDLLASLRATIEGMGLTAQRVTAEAQAVADDHGRALGRLARVAQAAARAEEAAFEAGRIAATVVVEAGPFADADAVAALRDTLAAQPGARDAYVRGVEDGRAVIEVHLAPPPA